MSSKLLLLGVVLAAGSSAMAGDLTPLQLAAPDAPIMIGINVDSIRLAYARSHYKDLLTPEYRAQYEQQAKSMKGMLGFDPSQLQEAVISVRPGPGGKSGQGLVILRGVFDPDQPPALLALMPTERSVYEGVAVMVTKQGKADPMAIAFLGRTMLVAGDPASVRAAISRWKSGIAAHSPWLERAEEMNRTFHVWCLARDLQSIMPHDAAIPKGADAITGALRSLEEVTLGMTLAPDLKASLELLARTPKDAAALQAALSMGMAMATMQPGAQQVKDLLKAVEVTTQERTVRLSVSIPEERLIEAAREQMKQRANWSKGTPLAHSGGGEVVVQGGETPGRPATPANSGDTQVVVLPR
ncbi:MAG TPA: hypothetical protein VN893_10630 [Bryobacteraceae bacterium]|nr:hypothetical protein [Bryobacteraceae bacterium]